MSVSPVKTVESDIATITFSGGGDDTDTSGDESSPDNQVDDELVIEAGVDVTKVDVGDTGDVIQLSQDDLDDLPRSHRFNPFNTEEDIEGGQEDLFPQLMGGPGLISAHMDLSEDHFSLPEGLSTASVEDLQEAIDKYKHLVLQCHGKSERHKDLVVKLIHLRLKLAEAKDNPEIVEPDIRHVVGHRFTLKDSSKHYCEKCNTMIWGVIARWYRCTECGFCAHDKCLNQITRTCPSLQVTDNPQYNLTICPERGLASQNYRCAECRSPISYQAGFGEPRQCDYSGSYYCNLCHWNDQVPVPARILHNWDFDTRKVCRASKQLLRLLCKKPVLRVQDVNPMLFSFVEELNQVKKLREEILIMKRYFLSCREALNSKLLLQLRNRQHFVENSDMYSLQDLLDTANDVLLPHLAKIHASFAQHIKTDCQTCQGKGYVCELCDYQEILFPFDNHAVVCAQCSTVLHRHCFTRRNQRCPKCERMSRRCDSEQGQVED